ncbi:MAG: hypothetical protein HRU22_01780 [Gammaproteobacteria bacterium]|nr:hypothetical protein [Gammaproteobacteria bacterium]
MPASVVELITKFGADSVSHAFMKLSEQVSAKLNCDNELSASMLEKQSDAWYFIGLNLHNRLAEIAEQHHQFKQVTAQYLSAVNDINAHRKALQPLYQAVFSFFNTFGELLVKPSDSQSILRHFSRHKLNSYQQVLRQYQQLSEELADSKGEHLECWMNYLEIEGVALLQHHMTQVQLLAVEHGYVPSTPIDAEGSTKIRLRLAVGSKVKLFDLKQSITENFDCLTTIVDSIKQIQLLNQQQQQAQQQIDISRQKIAAIITDFSKSKKCFAAINEDVALDIERFCNV